MASKPLKQGGRKVIMFKKKLLNNVSNILRKIESRYRYMAKKLSISLWQLWIVINGRGRYSRTGFILPTVTMVLLVVVLLSIAILLRSFDRADVARNVKVNQQVLTAATPALERAAAKIDYLLKGAANGGDPTLPPGTPSEDLLYKTLYLDMEEEHDKYTFGDEEKLEVSYDLNGDGNIQEFGAGTAIDDGSVQDDEVINTAWRYPVDTDNNGLYDTYTIYGIFLRTPEVGREYQPLEARTPPQPVLENLTKTEPLCEAINTSSNLISSLGWYKTGTQLKKSIFVYTVNVPITEPQGTDQEKYQGSPALSALEYQRDYSQDPITNNVVFYNDDLEAAPGFEFNLNGRIVANGNLMVTSFNTPLKFYQVSGRSSCFYQAENSKILIGGELIHGRVRRSSEGIEPEVHLFKGKNADPSIVKLSDAVQSVADGSNPLGVTFNDNAYFERIEEMVEDHIDSGDGDPDTVTERVLQRIAEGEPYDEARQEALENYFEDRTRKVPFAEVGLKEFPLYGYEGVKGNGNDLRPQDDWILPTGGNAGVADTNTNTGLTLQIGQPPATRPAELEELGTEELLGDRIAVGNNLPALRYDESIEDEDVPFAGGDSKQYLGGDEGGAGESWSNDDSTCENIDESADECRWRQTQITAFADVGEVDRNSEWELAAAQNPNSATEGYGGLRVITGAGVYDRIKSFLPPPTINGSDTYDDPATTVTEAFPIVWPDLMPMSPVPLGSNSAFKVYDNESGGWVPYASGETAGTPTIDPKTDKYEKGDLRMRATVVYHYANNGFDEGSTPTQTPLACISSYYDPTDATTSKNLNGLPWDAAADGKSHNGIVYNLIREPLTRPTTATKEANGLFTDPGELATQANYVFPNGRFANEPLRDALTKLADGESLSIADESALDTTLCALGILDDSLNPTTADDSKIPHGAITETAFLNPREIQAIDKDNEDTVNDETFTLSSTLDEPAELTGEYQLPLEERQPLEIRVTQLDMDVLRNTEITPNAVGIPALEPEYLLPYSGLVYASRDDALPDRSHREPDEDGPGIDDDESELLSPTDSKLDPTRRPNGIMLVNGTELNRGGTNDVSTIEDVVKEKGLILISNVPTYIKGDFNLHDHYEFLDGAIDWDFNAYYNPNKVLDTEFACRGGDPRIPGNCGGAGGGDKWRPVEIMSDSLTILSNGFRPGFRNEGDFDHRNNAGNLVTEEGYDINGDGVQDPTTTTNEEDVEVDLNGDGKIDDTDVAETDITTKAARLINGFYANNFSTNGLSSGAAFLIEGTNGTYTDAGYKTNTGDAPPNSSYFNNFVTPVQRRENFNEYLMEMCFRLPVSSCRPQDWGVVNGNIASPGIKQADQLLGLTSTDYAGSGTTAQPPLPAYQRYPRRVAFSRDPSFLLILKGGQPVPLGINDPNDVVVEAPNGTNARLRNNALWFRTQGGWNKNQPLFYNHKSIGKLSGTTMQPPLIPALQIHATTAAPQNNFPEGNTVESKTRWQMPVEADTTVNVMMATGDVPPRVLSSNTGETNGGLPNLPRFIENWQGKTSEISGAFVQLRRSAYSTAPYQHVLEPTPPQIFDNAYGKYNAGETGGTAPASTPPTREWSYDVGLLSQSPDLFAAKLSTMDPVNTREYYREVGIDDRWIQTLLCSKTDSGNAVGDAIRPTTDFCDEYTGG